MRVVLSHTLVLAACALTAGGLAACGGSGAGRDAATADTATPDAAAPADTGAAAGGGGATQLASRLVGTWVAEGRDSGATDTEQFTITWREAPGGGLTGTIAFPGGRSYSVKSVSVTDNSLVYESEPHRSPTLNSNVVTRTEAELTGDSLTGNYEAKSTTGNKSLRGRFTARRSGAAR